jgi:hypothetical protein
MTFGVALVLRQVAARRLRTAVTVPVIGDTMLLLRLRRPLPAGSDGELPT